MEEHRVRPGRPHPLGAAYDGAGTNFAVYSGVAERVELCLLHDDGSNSTVELEEQDGFIRHAHLPGVAPGQRYGFRVHGPHDPARGLRCNPAKLLLDPYARAISGRVDWHPSVYGHPPGRLDERDDRDSAPHTMASVVTDPSFDWGDDRPPEVEWHRTVLYEAHVRGLTMRHPEVPPQLRGTYAALAHPAVVGHLVDLGVTALELMPVHQSLTDHRLAEAGLTNYWGYNTVGFFAPHHGYSSSGDRGQQVTEFRTAVRALHAAGIEVILDVVHNHTAEGSHLGPTLSWRGLDNAAYYRLAEDPRFYADTTGTGNSLRMRSPQTLRMIMDSLRYWVAEMHVDGFRFDLAATLAREFDAVDPDSSFLSMVRQDPVVGRVKLIAEPWDLGEGGYRVGGFPAPWAEWNGRYRDTVRDLWRGEPGVLADFGSRLTGSSDLYQAGGRRPQASVNFVTCHDGFTLRDLVSYDTKHNEANGEDGRDGENTNRSWNCGVEGPTDDPETNALRGRQCRNLIATLMLSQGVPMLSHGDEFGRTQDGNNNAYCQDGELTWVPWPDGGPGDERDAEALRLLEFTRTVVRLRRDHPVLRRQRFLLGRVVADTGSTLPDIAWFTPQGGTMAAADWQDPQARSVTVLLNGRAIGEPGPGGERITGDSFLLMVNAAPDEVEFTVPAGLGTPWRTVLDTALPDGVPPGGGGRTGPGGRLRLTGRSLALLQRPDREEPGEMLLPGTE